MATVGCGISHKDTKHTDKCSNNKTKKNRNKTTKPQTNTFSKYCEDKTQKKFDLKYVNVMLGPYNTHPTSISLQVAPISHYSRITYHK